jgi:hypothetical protein
MRAKYTIEILQKFYESKSCTLLSTEYKSENLMLEFICQCGIISSKSFRSFRNVSMCDSCTKRRQFDKQRLNFEDVSKYFLDNNCVLLSEESEYKTVESKLRYVCSCGNESTVRFGNFKFNNARCKKCGDKRAHEKQKIPYSVVYGYFQEHGCTLISTEYINNQSSLEFICSCGRLAHTTFDSFKDTRNNQRCNACGYDATRGNKSHFWNPLLTDEDRFGNRNHPDYAPWRRSIYMRDNYTCQCCGDNKGGNLNAHHLDGWNWCKERRFDVSNGITLCDTCHNKFHNIFGYGENREIQFKEWLDSLFAKNLI